MIKKEKINVFISYSWNENLYPWVEQLGQLLEMKGVNVIIDKKETRLGHNMYYFMENSIRIADVVLMIFTPTYKKKAESRMGGVGYEFNIITPLMLNNLKTNEKYIGVLRKGNWKTSVPINMTHNIHLDLRAGKGYTENLNTLLDQITKTPIKIISNSPTMDDKYLPINEILPVLKESVHSYFEKFFGVKSSDNALGQALLKPKVKMMFEKWEKDINTYTSTIQKKFNLDIFDLYEEDPEQFRTKVFKAQLWTVGSALKSSNPDLARYKIHFADADPAVIVKTVKDILTASKSYIAKKAKNINYAKLKTVESLDMDYLDSTEMFMNRIIGYGIRSEILHRNFPAYFPVMTQKSLWALYFMSQSSEEFINIETKNRDGLIRVSHNWEYNYQRFTYLMTQMALELQTILKKFDCNTKTEFRFGYINMFLTEVDKFHQSDRSAMHEWKENKKKS